MGLDSSCFTVSKPQDQRPVNEGWQLDIPAPVPHAGHTLLGVDSWGELTAHPKLGASWEGFALEQAWIVHPGDQRYAVHAKVEVVPLKDIADALAFMGARARRARNGY